ncbi:TrkA family potassium uptake protein [Halobacteriales archaeon QS_8_65_32]|nr:MAG: TrkA family potassium uptake protein [Halobacteriales archaeon QS_8_65_32]
MYAIVVGAGDIGTPLIDIATRSGKDAVMIERNAERAEEAADEFDCLVLNDNATTKDALEGAGAERAGALISTTEADATNFMVCLIAQELDIPEIVSVVHNPEHMSIFEQIGVNTMENPQRLIAEHTLVDSNEEGLLYDNMLVVAIERNGAENPEAEPATPRGDTRIEVGDLLTVYSATGATPETTDVFGHYADHIDTGTR